MKRFEFHDVEYGEPAYMAERNDGEYVLWEDAKKEIDDLKLSLKIANDLGQALMEGGSMKDAIGAALKRGDDGG